MTAATPAMNGVGKIWWKVGQADGADGADGAAYRAAAHTDFNSGWCRQHVFMLHQPSATVRRSAYGPFCQVSNQMVSPFGGTDCWSFCVSLWLKSTSFHLLQTGFMPTSHPAVRTCLTPALTNPQQTWSTSLQTDESLTSQTRFQIPPGHEIQRRR